MRFMPKISSRRHFIATTALLAASAISPTFFCSHIAHKRSKPNKFKNIVLVHGAFADGSCYAEVIRHLQEAGFNAVAVQNPLTSLSADAQTLKHTLQRVQGKSLLVGHSWGGVPITEVGTHEKVAALVYLQATQPDNGECAAEALERQNAPMKGLSPDANGEMFLPAEAFADVMANDLPAKQSHLFIFQLKDDHALAYEVQQRFVKQINAKPKELANWLIEIANLI